jgi:hypothetical protein
MNSPRRSKGRKTTTKTRFFLIRICKGLV